VQRQQRNAQINERMGKSHGMTSLLEINPRMLRVGASKTKKADRLAGDLPFNAVRNGNEASFLTAFFYNKLTPKAPESCSSSCCLLVRLLVRRASWSSLPTKLLLPELPKLLPVPKLVRMAAVAKRTSDQSGDQFVHFVNPQL